MTAVKRTASVLASGLLMAAGLATAPAAHATTYTHWWTNCTAMHQLRWAHGVGKRYAHDHTSGTPVTNFYHSTYWYNRAMAHNSGLDRDKDGIACEAH